MKFRRYLIFSLLCVFLLQISFSASNSLTISSPSYFNDQNNVLEDISYLDGEFLSFDACFNDQAQNLSAVIICGSNEKEIPLIKYAQQKQGCYFSNLNLEEAQCSDFTLEVRYVEESTQKIFRRTFSKEKQSKLINHVLGEEPNSLNAEELSYYLTVLNNVESKNSQESQEVYDRLRNLRNNANKCWPSNSCSVSTSAEILRNLKISEYSLDTRILEDGETYLEKNFISNDNDPLGFIISLDYDFDSNEEISCGLTIDNDDEKNYVFEEDDNLSLDDVASERIEFNCNTTIEEINFKLYNLEDKVQENIDYDDASSFSYDIESFACVGKNNCNFDDTINSLITYGNLLSEATELDSYISSLIIEDDDEIYLDAGNRIESTGKYLYYKTNNELIENLKFSQNNDGSWGSGDSDEKVGMTAWSILGLQKSDSQNSENVQDAKEWIYNSEPSNGWGSLEKNSLAFLAIKERVQPYVKLKVINNLKESHLFSLENPTIYNIRNVKLELSEEIDKSTSYIQDLGNLDGETSKTFKIEIDEDFFGELSGNLKITGVDGKGNTLTLVEFPLNIQGPSPFNIESGSYTFTESEMKVQIPISHNIDSYTSQCTFTNPFSNIELQKTIDDSTKFFEITNIQLIEGEFTLPITCSQDSNSFTQVIDINVSLIDASFNFAEDIVLVNSLEDIAISINNTLEERQTLRIDVIGDYEGIILPTENQKIFAAFETREIYLTINDSEALLSLGNQTSGEVIITSATTGYSKRIPIILENEISETSGSNWIWITIIGILVFGFIFLLIIRYIQLQRMEEEDEDYNEGDEEVILDNDIEFK